MIGHSDSPMVREAVRDIVSRARSAAMKHFDDYEMQAVLFVVDEYEKMLYEKMLSGKDLCVPMIDIQMSRSTVYV